LDPAHNSFLHKLIGKSEQRTKIETFASKGDLAAQDRPSLTNIWGEDASPTIEYEMTDFGIRYVSVRNAGSGRRYLRGGSWIMPNLVAAPGSTAGDGYTLSWHVPIDDQRSWRYALTYRRGGDADPEGLSSKQFLAEMGPNYRPIRNKANRFLQDREQMRTGWASGFGPSIIIQDVAITDSQGTIPDRTEERLGYTDRVIVATRLMMLKCLNEIKTGRRLLDTRPKQTVFPVVVSTVVADSEDWKECYRKRVKEEEAIALSSQKVSQ
jgi:phthalate 4,5-dioxygenase oxygenase subunit